VVEGESEGRAREPRGLNGDAPTMGAVMSPDTGDDFLSRRRAEVPDIAPPVENGAPSPSSLSDWGLISMCQQFCRRLSG
jgi:hypothetical protein